MPDLRDIFDHTEAAGTELLVLACLAAFADAEGAVVMPYADLARRVRLTIRHTRRAMAALQSAGLIAAERRGSREYVYRLTGRECHRTHTSPDMDVPGHGRPVRPDDEANVTPVTHDVSAVESLTGHPCPRTPVSPDIPGLSSPTPPPSTKYDCTALGDKGTEGLSLSLNSKSNDRTSTDLFGYTETIVQDPVVLTFECNGPTKSWELKQSKVGEWQEAFPGLDIEGECRKALQWIRDNPGRRKTANGMSRFLGTWLAKTNDRPRDAAKSEDGPPIPPRRNPTHEELAILFGSES